MAWAWDSTKHRYVDGDRALTQRELLDLRNSIADGMGEESAALARQLIDGVVTLAQWARAFAKLIRDGIGAAFLLGRGGAAQVDATATETLDALIADQLGFAKQFATALADLLDAGTATVEGVAARSALYGGGAIQAFHKGQAEDWRIELPFYPADGDTICLGNCRCEWSIEDSDEGITATWVTVGDANTCKDCEDRGKQYGPGSPFVQKKAA